MKASPLLEAVKLDNETILRDVRLENLGRINVICGRNNAGKTSILKHIAFTAELVTGFTLKPDDLRQLIERWRLNSRSEQVNLESGTRSLSSLLTSFSVDVEALFWEFYRRSIFCYRHGVDEFANKYIDLFIDACRITTPSAEVLKSHDDRHRTKDALSSLFGEVFASIVPRPTLKPIYISPKRLPKTITSLTKVRDVANTGENVVEKLFHLKSSLPGSTDRKLYEQVFYIFNEVTEGFEFDVAIDYQEESSLALYFSKKGMNNWIPASSSGLGLQDALVIIYFALDSANNLLLIEEPENHLHPDMQRRLLRFLKNATPPFKQFILSTHSSVFLDGTLVDRVFLSRFEDGKVNVSDATSRANVLRTLGYSVNDNLVSDLIILVEGAKDKAFLEEFFVKMRWDERYNIKIWILGGDGMVNQDLSAFRQDYKLVALVDRDDQSHRNRETFANRCADFNIQFTRLQRYSIESYFSATALNEVFNKHESHLHEIIGMDNPSFSKAVSKKPVWEALGDSPERVKELKGKIKNKVREIAREMKIEDLKGTDLMKFFKDVERLLTE